MNNSKLFKNNDPEFFKKGKETIGTDLLFASKLFCEYVCNNPKRIRVGAGYKCFNQNCPIGICKLNRKNKKANYSTGDEKNA